MDRSNDNHSSRTPGRLCLGCGYPLAASFHPQCPECGREYDPRDPTTYASRYGQDHSYRIGGFTGTLCVPFVFMILYTIQHAAMEWWHDTGDIWWWGAVSSCRSAWWELNDLGAWLWPLQMLVFLVHSIVTGMIISRITIDRHAPKMTG